MKINKRIAISFLTIAGVLTAVVGITLAQVSDTATLANNTLSVGSASLRIATATDGVCSNSTSDSISGVSTSKVAPGYSGDKQFCLKNTSDSDISLNVTAVATVDTGVSTLETSKITVKVNCAGDDPAKGVALTLDGATVSGLIVNVPHGTVEGNPVLCRITQTLKPDVTNDDAGKNIKYNVVFTGTGVEP